LNPRLGAGLSIMTRDLADLPVCLLDRALVEGELLAYGAGDLERQVLAAADRTRAGGARTVTDVALEPGRVPVGRSVAPLAVAGFALADEWFGSGIGPLEPGRPVR